MPRSLVTPAWSPTGTALKARTGERSGITLIVISGLMALLVLLGASFLNMAGHQAVFGASRTGLTLLGIAAESGLQYAGARLTRDAARNPFQQTPETRSDDWRSRDDPQRPLDANLNPSYNHGEPWKDSLGGRQGAFDVGETPLQDLDNNGRFSAWSGRLRGGSNAFDLKFSLKIEAVDGKIPINFRSLLPATAGGETRWTPVQTGGTILPPFSTSTLPYLLENLLLILAVEPWSEADPSTGHLPDAPPLASRCLPPYGAEDEIYGCLDRVDNVLKEYGWTSPERKRFLSLINVGPYDICTGYRPGEQSAALALPVSEAPREVLEAFWTGMIGFWDSGLYARFNGPEFQDALLNRCSDFPCDESGAFIHLGEARDLTDLVVKKRQNQNLGWKDLYGEIVGKASTIFGMQAAEVGGGRTGHWWAQTLADVAFRGVSPDQYSLASGTDGSVAWASWGINRGPPSQDAEYLHPLPFTETIMTQWRQFPSTTAWPHAETAHPPAGYGQTAFPNIILTTAPPAWFSMESVGLSNRHRTTPPARTRFRRLEVIDFTSQEDFENLDGNPRLVSRGIKAVDGGMTPEVRHGQTTPGVFPITSLPDFNKLNYARDPAMDRYSSQWGALGLSPQTGGRRTAHYYWAFSDEYDRAGELSCVPEIDPALFIPAPARISGGTAYFPSGSVAGFDVIKWPIGSSSPLKSFSIDCWMAASSSIRVYKTSSRDSHYFDIKSSRSIGTSGNLGTTFDVKMRWGGSTIRAGQILIPDATDDPDFSWHYHVVLAVRLLSTGNTVTLFINGQPQTLSDAPPALPISSFTGALTGTTGLQMDFAACDEIRLHMRDLSGTDAQACHDQGRFHREGTYISPLYVLNRAGSILQAQWTGACPPHFPPEALRVRVHGFSDDLGQIVLGTWDLDKGGLTYSAPPYLSAVKSFRYEVRFDCRRMVDGGPMRDTATAIYDTPIFESIWFALARPGQAPLWHSYE